MIHEGSCHCGRIAYAVEGDIEQVIDCNCSHCRRKGYLLWFRPRTALTLKVPESDLATYTFNTHKIRHQFCPECGVATFGFGQDKHGNALVAVNVRCLPEVELGALNIIPVDGKSA